MSWTNLRWYPCICLEQLRKTGKAFSIVTFPANIRIEASRFQVRLSDHLITIFKSKLLCAFAFLQMNMFVWNWFCESLLKFTDTFQFLLKSGKDKGEFFTKTYTRLWSPKWLDDMVTLARFVIVVTVVKDQRSNSVERASIVTSCVCFPTFIVLREDKWARNEVFRVSFPHGGGRVLWEVAPPICMCTYC